MVRHLLIPFALFRVFSLVPELRVAPMFLTAPPAGVDRGLSPVLQVDTDARFGRFEEVLLCTSVFTHR